MTETDTIQIQQNVPVVIPLTLTEEINGVDTPIDLTGKTVFISVKQRNDYKNNDSDALISSSIVVHTNPPEGETDWWLTAAETYIPFGKYKADVRVFTNLAEYVNTDTFYIDLVPVVTQRTS